MTTPRPAKDKIILALDVADAAAAVRLAGELSGVVSFFKIGLELFTRAGPAVIAQVRSEVPDARIFLDLKLHDIPNTVARAVQAACALEVDFLTIHLAGGAAMVRAAAGASAGGLQLLGVTVLTSSDEETLRETGVNSSVADQVLRLATLGVDSGLRGVVASPLEIGLLRAKFGAELAIVVPGVRPASATANTDDQRRVMTPRQAVDAGADYLVIGRPITGQADPRAAAEMIVREMTGAA